MPQGHTSAYKSCAELHKCARPSASWTLTTSMRKVSVMQIIFNMILVVGGVDLQMPSFSIYISMDVCMYYSDLIAVDRPHYHLGERSSLEPLKKCTIPGT